MENLVEVKNNQVVVSSRQIAKHFNKEHKVVLRSIREIQSVQNCADWFYQSKYKDIQGRVYTEYLMNRDGFSLTIWLLSAIMSVFVYVISRILDTEMVLYVGDGCGEYDNKKWVNICNWKFNVKHRGE